MHKVFLKIAILLGAILCLSVVHNGAITAEEAANSSEEDTALSGIRFTVGVFASGLRNELYVPRDDKVARGAQDHYPLSIGGLAHVPLWPRLSFSGLRGSPALSGGFAGDFSTRNGQLAVDGQVALGLSLLFDSGEHLFALTAGYIVRPVARLSGYEIDDPFPAAGVSPTKSVYRHGLFLGVTSNFEFPNLSGSKTEKVSQQGNGTQSEDGPKRDSEDEPKRDGESQ